MKTCPSCRKTYTDESLVFCLDDGTRLVREGAVSDPNATWNISPPGPTVASPRPTPPTAQSTLASAPERFQYARPPVSPVDPRGDSRRSALPWVFAIVLVIGASGVLIAWIMMRGADDTSGKYPMPTPKPSVMPSPTPMPTKEPPREMFTLLQNMTFEGSRITYYPRTSFELCREDCAGNAKCNGLTWIKPGAYNPGDPGMCYLMSAVTNRVPHACCISAVRN